VRELVEALDEGYEGIDLIRFRDDPLDKVLAMGVRLFAEATDSEREKWQLQRREMAGQLLLGIRRLGVIAWRRRSAADALTAVSMGLLAPGLDPGRSDPVRFAAVIATQLGADPQEAFDGREHLLDDSDFERLNISLEAAERVSDVIELGCHWVSTRYGDGLVRLPVKDLGPRPSWLGEGVNARDIAPRYEPETNLAALAVQVADAIDARGELRTMDIEWNELAANYFEELSAGSVVASTGTLAFSIIDGDSLECAQCFTAEIGLDGDAKWYEDVIEELDPDGSTMLAASQGKRLVFLTATPSFDGDDTPKTNWASYRDLLREALDATR
jgi:hypothetical protein